MRKFFAGLAAGLTCSYLAVRTLQAARDLRSPAPPLANDAAAYGRLRRAQMIGGIARSACALGFLAFEVLPSVEGTPSRTKASRS